MPETWQKMCSSAFSSEKQILRAHRAAKKYAAKKKGFVKNGGKSVSTS